MMDTNSMPPPFSAYQVLVLAAVVPATVFAGCANSDLPDALHYNGKSMDFSEELILRVNVSDPSAVEYDVYANTNRLARMDICFLRAGQLEAWRADHSIGLHCDLESLAGDGRLSVEPGKYVIAMACLKPENSTDGCHVRVILHVQTS